MPSLIAKQPKVIREQISLRLDKELIDTLDAYCRFVDGSRDYVVAEALALVFKKDREFSAKQDSSKPEA